MDDTVVVLHWGDRGVRKRKSVQEQGGAVGRSIDTDVYKSYGYTKKRLFIYISWAKVIGFKPLPGVYLYLANHFLRSTFFPSPPCSFFILANLVL
jgi:hypothetical protein